MRKFLYVLLFMVSSVMAQSCMTLGYYDTDNVKIVYYDDFLYLGNYYPVVYINTTPYFYYENTWRVIHSDYYVRIRHYHEPYHFYGHMKRDWHTHYNPHPYIHPDRRPVEYYRGRPNYNKPNVNYRPTQTRRPDVKPNITRPDNNHGNYNQRPINNRNQNQTINRNTNRPPVTRGAGVTPNRGRR